ncbi:MAG: hypothetical protein LBF78_05905 [Treponema sp.]|jgi:hypothetical protein|nr:hypothetical protein [Treponema sp.]
MFLRIIVVGAVIAWALAGCDNIMGSGSGGSGSGNGSGSSSSLTGTSWRATRGTWTETVYFSSSTWSASGTDGYSSGTYTRSGNTVNFKLTGTSASFTGTISGNTLYVLNNQYIKQ